jgi:ferredoxin-nitrite reductase
LSVHADPLARNTIACTGGQFCNIAVTSTKGHMFQLIERLRQKGVMLNGIRIHMSGCPSSCAGHFTADIGLKGVRVRRLLGTREGFDLFLGGGIAGQVHLGLPYKLGVDVDQLPQVIEEVVSEYYLRHRMGQTFSAYWRERLRQAEAQKVGDADYRPPVWVCEACDYRHAGEDPPVFCPSCAGLRRNFARIEEETGSAKVPEVPDKKAAASRGEPPRSDGFVFAAKAEAVSDKRGLCVTVAGKEYALFRVDGTIRCIDAACPHEGGPMAEGDVTAGVVTCPWHSWTFDLCKGCSLDPPGHAVQTYETLVEESRVFIRPTNVAVEAAPAPVANVTAPPRSSAIKLSPPIVARLPVLEVIEETPDVRTFRFDNSAAKLPLDHPGRFAKVCIPTADGEMWRSFTISSSPSDPRVLELTVKLNPSGRVSTYLHENVRPGSTVQLKGPLGGFYFDRQSHREPLVLIAAGSGITPMMSIARFLRDTADPLPCAFLYGARTEADVIFHEECLQMAAERPSFRYFVTLSQPGPAWMGAIGRLDMARILEHVVKTEECRFFLCGPHDFMETLQAALWAAGVPRDRIHTEQFHATKTRHTAIS